MEAPKPFYFKDGGGDLLVMVKDHHRGWTDLSTDQKVGCSTIVYAVVAFLACEQALRLREIGVSEKRYSAPRKAHS